MKPFEYAEPRSLAEVFRELEKPDGQVRLLAGGTDLVPRLKRGVWKVSRLINLKRIDALRGISEDAEGLAIGPLTTVEELARSEAVSRRCPILADAARLMASAQVRNLATVGGNLANASPAADLATPMLVLEAVLTASGPWGERPIPIREFFVGPGKTALAREEVLTRIRIPGPAGRGVFFKFSPRRAMDLAVVNVACLRPASWLCQANGDVRVAVGACAPTPLRVPADPEGASKACSPIDDVRGSADYRRDLVRVLVRRALERVS